jgi:hypothetical protein
MILSRKSNCKLWLRLGVLALCFFLLGAGRLFSQVDTGSISGTVTDPSDAVVPGVKVTIVAVATNQQQTFVTDSHGRYSSGPLRVGEYRIEAEGPGFKRLIRPNILLEIQQTLVINLQLVLGELNQVLTVVATPLQLQTGDASQGSVIGERRVRDLPLNGRDYLQLALLSEGTAPPPGEGRDATGSNSGTSARAGGFSAGGQRATDNNYLLDGFDNNLVDDSFDTNTAEVIKPSIDAIEEFKVQTSSYPAQFGRAAGGVVNLSLLSGANRFHGTAYDFVRNEKLDARNFFDTIGSKPSYKRNDFGLSVGGPVKKDKAFFFFAYEDQRIRESLTNVNTIPTLAMRAGDFSALNVPIYNPLTYDPTTQTRQVFPGNIIPPDQIDPIAGQLIKYYPVPQNANLASNYTYITPNDENLSRINTREDYQFSQKDHLSWIFNRDIDDIPASAVYTLPPPAFGGNSRAFAVTTYGTGLTWTHIVSPGLVTSTKAGFFKDTFYIYFPPAALALGNLAAKIGLPEPPSHLPVSDPTTDMSGYSSLGVGNWTPVWSEGENRQFKTDTTWIKGGHTMQFGVAAEWIQTNDLNARQEGGEFYFSGRYTNNPLTGAGGNAAADFLLGNVDNSTFTTDTKLDSRAIFLAGYFQDDWKVNQRFTLNLGLRYEFLRPFEDIYNKLANVDMDTNPVQPQLILEGQAGKSSFYQANPYDFQPRVGLAYQLLPGKVVVRAGYGIFSPFPRFSPFGDSQSDVENPPYNVAITTSSDGITPWGLLRNGFPPDLLSLQQATNVSLASQQRNSAHAYTQQWNMNVQYQFAKNWLFQVGYFGAKGTHLANIYDANYVTSLGPGVLNLRRRVQSLFVPTSIPGAAGPVSGVVISPLSTILRTENTGNTNFNSMQARVEHQFSGGFTILASWIWSKGLGDIQGYNPQGASPGDSFQNPADLRQEHALLDTQLAQSFVLSGIWDLPYGHGRAFGSNVAPVINAVLGGWDLGGILTLSSGRPYTINTSTDNANCGQTDRPNLVGNPYAVPGGKSVAEYFNTAAFAPNAPYTYGDLGRNSIIGPGYEDVDLSLMKEVARFNVKEQPVKFQFRWDFFNTFNHPNFGFPNNVLGAPGFGQLTFANNPRQMQVALKFIF